MKTSLTTADLRTVEPLQDLSDEALQWLLNKSEIIVLQEGDYLFGWNPAGAVTRTMLVICK